MQNVSLADFGDVPFGLDPSIMGHIRDQLVPGGGAMVSQRHILI